MESNWERKTIPPIREIHASPKGSSEHYIPDKKVTGTRGKNTPTKGHNQKGAKTGAHSLKGPG